VDIAPEAEQAPDVCLVIEDDPVLEEIALLQLVAFAI
jgi:hypothetical protein